MPGNAWMGRRCGPLWCLAMLKVSAWMCEGDEVQPQA